MASIKTVGAEAAFYITQFYSPPSKCGGRQSVCTNCSFLGEWCKGCYPAQHARCVGNGCEQSCGTCFGGQNARIPGICGKLPEQPTPLTPEKVSIRDIPKRKAITRVRNNIVIRTGHKFMNKVDDGKSFYGVSIHAIPRWLSMPQRKRAVFFTSCPDDILEIIWLKRKRYADRGFRYVQPVTFSDYYDTPLKNTLISYYRTMWYLAADKCHMFPLGTYEKYMRIQGPCPPLAVLERVKNVHLFLGFGMTALKKRKDGSYSPEIKQLVATLKGWNQHLAGHTVFAQGVNNPRSAALVRKFLPNAGRIIFAATEPAYLAVQGHFLDAKTWRPKVAPPHVPKSEILQHNCEVYYRL